MPQGLEVRDGQNRVIVDTNRFVLREVAAIFADAANTADAYVNVSIPTATNVVVSNPESLDDPLVDASYANGTVRYRYYNGGGANSRLSVLAY